MKLAIVTLIGNVNYGNRLQNYAMQSILTECGHKTETLNVLYGLDLEHLPQSKLKCIIKMLVPIVFIRIWWCFSACVRSHVPFLHIKRMCNFEKFNKVHLNMRNISCKTLQQLADEKAMTEYDCFIAGSDQVWNPNFAGSDYYFLTFAPSEKRTALMASIGTSAIPDGLKERYAELLGQMRYISVREEAAVQIIEELLHKRVDCFPDPTLLLGRENWEKIMRSPTFPIPDRYVLSFFLLEEPEKKIEAYAIHHNLTVVHMNQRQHKQYYVLGPEQMLYMVKNASVIMTDSFHAAAFSIVFQRQFYVFRRREVGMENMFSRMETLLGKFGLEWRIQDGGEIEDRVDITMQQYEEIERILRSERDRFNDTVGRIFGDSNSMHK